MIGEEETCIRASCQGCRLDVTLPAGDFIAVRDGDRIQLVWACPGCGIGVLTLQHEKSRVAILASGCVVIRAGEVSQRGRTTLWARLARLFRRPKY